MNQNLKVERLYSLGDYKNIKFTSELNDVPEELLQNKEVVSLLQLNLMLQCEQAHLRYLALFNDISNLKTYDEKMTYINDLREKTLLDLINYFDKNEGD